MDKKEKRKESKKRKLDALIGITEINLKDASVAKKALTEEIGQNGIPLNLSSNTPNEEEKALIRAKRRAMQKATMEYPVFYVSGEGHDAEVIFHHIQKSEDGSKKVIFLNDIQHLMLASMLGRRSPHRTRWCKLMRNSKLTHSTIMVIDGFTFETFKQNFDSFQKTSQLFQTGVLVNPPIGGSRRTTNELLNIPIYLSFKSKLINRLQSRDGTRNPEHYISDLKEIFPISEEVISEETNPNGKDNKVDRKDLLLDLLGMLRESYPFTDRQRNIDKDGCKFTKEKYNKVTSNSPIFALDCEMCQTEAFESELTRISIVNESLEVVYDKLVKPYGTITNYLTQYSGVTKSMLANVTTRLEDVQEDVRKILPADAILCGHSMNNDLHAMMMLHPYVIDTSVIYNTSGMPWRKPSLKGLSQMYLNEIIQNSSSGHDSVEDGVATMKLVLLKLKNAIEFGNVMFDSNSTSTSVTQVEPDMNNGCKRDSFFQHSVKEDKKICIVGPPHTIDEFSAMQNVKAYGVNGNKEIVKKTRQVLLESHMTICNIDLGSDEMSEKTIKKLDTRIGKLYKSSALKSLFVVLFTGKDKQNGFCMTRIKR